MALWENDKRMDPLGRGHVFSRGPSLITSLLKQTVLFVPNVFCSLMPKCDHLYSIISRIGYQILTDLGVLSFVIVMGVAFGLLTGQCETTLPPPLSLAQGLP